MCACAHTKKMASQTGNHDFWLSGYECLARLQSCENMMGLCTAPYNVGLFRVETTVRSSHTIQIAHLKKKERKKEREKERTKERRKKIFWLFCCFLSQWCFSESLGVLLVMKTLKDGWNVEIWKDVCITIYCMSTPTLHIVCQLCDKGLFFLHYHILHVCSIPTYIYYLLETWPL